MKPRTLLLILMTILGMLLALGLQGCLFGGSDEDEAADAQFDEEMGEPSPEMGMGMPMDDDMMMDDPDMAGDMPAAPAGGADALVAEGMEAKHDGNYVLATEKFEAAVAADPSDVDAQWGLAWVYAESGRPGEAIAAFEAVIELGASADRIQEAEAAIGRLR